jgi:hypothetical protein
MSITPASLTVVARRFSFIRETLGPNRGFFVSFLQRLCHGQPGDSWCADFVSLVLEVAFMGAPPLPRTGSTQVMLHTAEQKHMVVTVPRPDDLYFYVNAEGVPHHVGIVTNTDPLRGIAGNTSEDGKSSNGTGVFEHEISAAGTVFVRVLS